MYSPVGVGTGWAGGRCDGGIAAVEPCRARPMVKHLLLGAVVPGFACGTQRLGLVRVVQTLLTFPRRRRAIRAVVTCGNY